MSEEALKPESEFSKGYGPKDKRFEELLGLTHGNLAAKIISLESTVTALRAQVVDLEESVIELRKSLIDTLECWTLEEEIFRNEKAVRARAVLVATALAATEG